MPVRSQDVTARTIETQVAVIGSGPGGAEVAIQLARRGIRVTVLESGLDMFDPFANALNEAEYVGRRHRNADTPEQFQQYLPANYQGLNRVREFGGTGNTWTGKWRSFSAADVAPRAWVPHSGWPIDYGDLDAAYREVIAAYGLQLGADHPRDAALTRGARAFADAGFGVVEYYNQGKTYRSKDALLAAEGATLSILLDATAVRLTLDEAGTHLAEVTCKGRSGDELSVRCQHAVLATGGLETPRILLSNHHQRPAGLGNGHDLVGRFLQDHPKIQNAELTPGPLLRRHNRAVQLLRAPRRCLCLALGEADLRKHELLDTAVFIKAKYQSVRNVLANRLKGEPIMIDGRKCWTRFNVTYASEQAPNPDSRITLSTTPDALGVPRMVVDWRFTDLDRRSFTQSAELLARRFRETGIGVIDYGHGETTELGDSMDAAHHIGTTRMGAHPREGVVDVNCTLFEVPNLHIASSAVFPTGISYSPTMTIVALSRRLAGHIARRLAVVPTSGSMAAS